MEVEKLVRMANQIAANMDYGPDKKKAADGIADHLHRFWTKAMCTLIVEGQRNNSVELSPVASLAVTKLADLQRKKHAV